MEKDLEKYLKILNSERCLKKPKEAVIVIEKLSKCFTQESSQFTVGLLVSLVLDENDGIFLFIWKASAELSTLSSVSAAFKLLDFLVVNFQKWTEHYFSILYKKCMYLLDTKFAKVKEYSLKLIKNVISADVKHTLDLSKLSLKLEKLLREETKIAGTVTEQIFILFGYLFEKYPESVKNEKWLLHKMLECLRQESTATKNISLGKIKGAFEGINGYLINYPPPDAETLRKIYEYIKKWSKFREDKKAVSKSGLNALQNHWRQFSRFIYEDKEFWRINLDVWINQKSADRHVAFKLLCSFYSVIALYIKQESNSLEARNYVKEFAKALVSNCNSYEKKAALVGLKLFVLTGLLSTPDFHETFQLVVNFIKKEESYKNYFYFPLCVECVSAFMLRFPEGCLSLDQLTFLQRLSVKLIENYPHAEGESQLNAVIALEKSFYMIGLADLQTAGSHIENVLYQGLIRTCSSMTQSELELLQETGQSTDSVCYKSFVGLWKYLLTVVTSPNLPVGGSFTLKKGVAVKIFDAFVTSFLKIAGKLNFGADPEKGVENPSDVQIFVNLVDLYEDLMALVDPFSLQKWLIEIFKTVICLSRKNPLVSGFYKIVTANLKVASHTNFFDDDDDDDAASSEKQKCLKSVRNYLEEILTKVGHYKGDLQVTCLKAVLAAPANVMESLVEKVVPTLEVVSHLSRNSFSLLKDLMDALEVWDLRLPSEVSEAIMKKILPRLDIFFQSPYFRGKNSVDSSKRGKKLKVEVIFNDSEFLTLQKKFLMFLGNSELGKGMNLIELTETESKRKMSDKELVYSLPSGKGWVELNLDEMVLRVADLAASCGDRKTRLAACELLYSMVMVVIGNINQLSGGYTYLFRKVVETCLLLGCDSDGLVCQIFEPLMYQISHYFSEKQGMRFSEVNDYVDVLMDSVTCGCNPAVRDFSGDLLREFIAWSIKQLSPEELKTTPECIKGVLERICSLALHPSYDKRLGAAVAFNRIYSVLREDDSILSTYWFHLFYHFMESLRMCEEPEDVSEITEAIRHVERPLVERRKEFNENSDGRLIPPEFRGGRLCHLVKWTMERACDVKPTTRRTAMALVQKLAPLVENCDSNLSFVSKQLQNFFQLKANTFRSNFNEEHFVEWLKYQSAGFEYSTWLLKEEVLTVEEVFQSKFKTVLKDFINGVLSHRERSSGVDGHKKQAIISFLVLLETLKERAYSFPPEHWTLMKTAAFRPTSLGFDLNDASGGEQLLQVLTGLLGHFAHHLTEYDWENFYRDPEPVIAVPVFGYIMRRGCVCVEHLEFLFALRVIEGSGIWSVFTTRMFSSMSTTTLLDPIFKCLFPKRGEVYYASALEPSCKAYLEEVLKILLKVSNDLEDVTKFLENEEEVREEETEKTLKKGEYFQFLFKSTIFNFLQRYPNSLINWVLGRGSVGAVRLLIQVLESLSKDSDLPLEIFLRWKDFENVPARDAEVKNNVLLHLAVSSARIIGTLGLLKTSPVAEKVYAALEKGKFLEMEVSETEMVMRLLPFLSGFAEGLDENDRLRMCLSEIQVDLNEVKNSNRQSQLQAALSGILRSLKATASLIVLDFVLSRAAWFNAVCKKEEVESGLGVFAESRTPLSHTVSALDLAYKYCFQLESPDFSPALIYKLFLGPLLRAVPNAAAYQLVNSNLDNLCQLITSYWGEDKSAADILTDMTRKISVARMFQTFITRLSKEELDQMPKERRQMIDGTVKKVFFFLKKPYPPRILKERYRKLMCEIFNMICCIVSARCVEEKFYKLFIFDERGSFLFETIEKNVKYNLEMDFEEIRKRKKHLTHLREAIAEEGRLPSFGGGPVKYIATDTLFSSSLQEEVTRFDLSSSFIRPLNSVAPPAIGHVEIELDMDSLNGHECMTTLVATITKLVRDGITPSDDVTELPCWLRFFVSVLKNSELCENLRLFVLKAIYNVQEFVGSYCHLIFSDLLDAILKLFDNYPMNYFLMDLIEMMVGWKHLPGEERSRLQLSELVKFILKKSDSLRRDVVNYNLEILKMVIQVWKERMYLQQLSHTAFKRLFESVEEDMRTRANVDGVTYLNAHFCGILLSNGIPAWREGCEKQFFDLVLTGFRDEYKHNQLFGEICGQALNHVQRTQPELLDELEGLVRDKILSLTSSWLHLLYGVHEHHPKMSSSFTFRIFSSAWDSMDSLTVKKLEMLLSHVSGSEAAEDVTFDRHVSAFIMDMLSSPDVTVQELSLRIAEKILDKLDGEKLKFIMKEVVRLQGSVHPGVRKWVYQIGKEVYRRGLDEELSRECKVILLRGLSDEEKELEEACLEFWREVLSFSSPTVTFPQILREMYTSSTEDVFLGNAARILLQLPDDDYRKQKEIFPHPVTHRCRFRKRTLVQGARQSFLLSLGSFGRTLTNHSLENLASLRHRNLLSTSLKFQPTLQQNGEELPGQSVGPASSISVAGSPYTRKFYRSQGKSSFTGRPSRNPPQTVEGTGGGGGVNIYGEYRDGDYPDIQIKHSQMAKLMEVLAKRDPQMARLFLVSFYSGLTKAATSEERSVLLSETSNCFENMLKSSGNFDPGVFGFVLQVLLHHGQFLDVDYQLISNAAISSNWVSLGALLIEQIITNKETGEPEPPKKQKGCAQPEESRWLGLARLYRSLEEFDVVSGIFLDKLSVGGDAGEAIRCESVWDWAEASRQYESALRSDPDSSQVEFYTESYLSCLAKLSNWSALNKCIRTAVDDDLGELWNNYYLLSWFLKSEMMISLGTDGDQFRSILEEFCSNSVKREILGANFGEEMTVFDWFSGNIPRAMYRIDKLCLDFLAGWSHLNRWSYNLRAAKLTGLQTLSELSFAVNTLAEVSKSQMERSVQTGVRRWEKSMPKARDELTVWDVKLGYRREFLKRLQGFDLTALEVKAELALAKAALSQDNLNLTKECLSRAKEKLPEGDFDLKAEHHICFNMGKMVVAKLKMKNPKVGLEVYLNVWNGITKQMSTAMETDSESSKTLMYSCNFTLGQLVSEILPFVRNGTASPEILESLCQKLSTGQTNVANALQEKGVSYFETAIDALANVNCSSDIKSNSYLELSKFFLKFQSSGSFEKLSRYLLKSMGLGNSEARHLFGCLLNAAHLLGDEHSLEDVLRESDAVPSWMFLMWINQMLARLNSNLFPFLKSVLLRVAEDYPNAIRYPLKVLEEVSPQDSKADSFLCLLRGVVSQDKLYDDFWNAVKYLAPPDLILRYYLEDALEEGDILEVRKKIARLREVMYSEEYARFRGSVFKWWEAFDGLVADLAGDSGDEGCLREKIKSVLACCLEAKELPSRKLVALLESYSPWLRDFHSLKVDTPLELPGQYEGDRQPIKKYLVTVSSFKSTVLLLESKCRPMRIGVLGNDAKEYKFLVKFGEDLRQDERIQQVFRHFNHRLRECKQTRRFSVDTYKVVPLTPSLGMIEWVENNVSLYEMMENCLGDDSDAIAKAQSAHLASLTQGSPLAVAEPFNGAVAAHLIAYETVGREKAISDFRATAQMFPRELLKKCFLNLSTSPEHFMHLRANFATSHAITCISHWLVGIGDRHLQNTLVSTESGRVLGIDFGYAFGFATQFLTPPELLPFRLSPQILNFMHPLGASGWIKQTMIHCLRVFRKERFGVRSVLEVFAEEPVVNWLKQAKKNANYNPENEGWHPREKLELVERKLKGLNPVAACEADLRAGHSRSKYLDKYLEVLKGSQEDNFRAKCAEDGLTEEEQVECLVDLATDPHVLAKTYIGWNPWL